MIDVIGVHVRPRELKDFIEDQFDDKESQDLNKEAVDRLYSVLSLDDKDPYNIAFIETFSAAAEMMNEGYDYDLMRDECLDNIGDVFLAYEDDEEIGEYDGELIFTFCLLLIDYLSIERDIIDIFHYPVEFITLFHNRFDITLEV